MKIIENNENIINFTYEDNDLNLEEFLNTMDLSGRLFRKLYKNKKILVNGKYQRKGLSLNKGDVVSLIMDDETEEIAPEKIEIDIIYEDDDLLLINKGPNIVVHPTKSHQNNTLANGVAYYFKENNIKKKIRFVNRLDMDTTGIVIIAKNSFAHQQMALQFENNDVEKKYLAIVQGVIKDEKGTIDKPIGREEEKSIKKIVTDDGQEALTKFKVLERYPDATLVEVQIITGRSHQIRVHMNYIGHPIIGDTLYNEKNQFIDRQALHSYYLKARHPRTKKSIEFSAPMPYDMVNLTNLMTD
ncbi:RluA family pseudouridine synthase [Tissierella sp. Yu-01]|uniref:RluA family pseudouridine synthase n=1 Tax=Tissierella sp. Yu-01 TaxID=3035694 RepID=UPI00240E44B2|nr:RluA family pseudouridine synthase [Tissierella sp. Yu-01]WFA09430.1 RluA family pseudouridine synthase [Tissierella sp. Yu-01]